jgi:hypothetical protein
MQVKSGQSLKKGFNFYFSTYHKESRKYSLWQSLPIAGIMLALFMAIAAFTAWANERLPTSTASDEVAINLNIKITLTVATATEVFSLSNLILDRDPMLPVVKSIAQSLDLVVEKSNNNRTRARASPPPIALYI